MEMQLIGLPTIEELNAPSAYCVRFKKVGLPKSIYMRPVNLMILGGNFTPAFFTGVTPKLVTPENTEK